VSFGPLNLARSWPVGWTYLPSSLFIYCISVTSELSWVFSWFVYACTTCKKHWLCYIAQQISSRGSPRLDQTTISDRTWSRLSCSRAFSDTHSSHFFTWTAFANSRQEEEFILKSPNRSPPRDSEFHIYEFCGGSLAHCSPGESQDTICFQRLDKPASFDGSQMVQTLLCFKCAEFSFDPVQDLLVAIEDCGPCVSFSDHKSGNQSTTETFLYTFYPQLQAILIQRPQSTFLMILSKRPRVSLT
jgi:hypothetical protein